MRRTEGSFEVKEKYAYLIYTLDCNIYMLSYCFTAVGVGVHVHVSITPITTGPPAQIFFGWHVFCSPGHCLLIFAMTLTLGSRSSFESIFCCYLFFHYFMRGIFIKHGRKLHRHLAHEPIIVNL